MTDAAHLPLARLAWHNGQPRSLDADDVYFSADGAAESERVFVQLNRLRERFAGLPADATFTIGEVGFGTGLNLMVCARAFLDCAPAAASLHFISCEQRPLAVHDIARLDLPAQLGDLHADLLAAWPPLLPGWQRFFVADERVRVSLFLGEALDAFDTLSPQVDAWLLDGFAPDRNPDAWRPALLAALRRTSRHGATAATFTSAGNVRRALITAGFDAERVSGQPHKLHYLAGSLPGSTPPRPAPPYDIVGSGLAGAWTARALAIRGCRVRVFERGEAIASETSSNPWAVLHARISVGRPALAALRLAGLALSAARLPGFAGYQPIGVLQRPGPGASKLRLQASADWLAHCWPHGRWLDAHAASACAGVQLDSGALWLPRSGAASLAPLCRALLSHPNISVFTGSNYTLNDADNGLPTTSAIWCTGMATRSAPLHAVGGYIEEFAVPTAARPACVLSGHGYLMATKRGVASGATFETDGVVRGLDAATRVQQWLGTEAGAPLGRWHGVRAMTPDRLPLVGRHGNRWLNCGHGSTGLALAPLAGEIVASLLLDEPLPAGAGLLDPARFA